ncbi:hypothetical protein JTE90_005671 [Oedothorax gibbosus]|uniref:Uncharacterized protein n=1 Tax=Oedothorax gibbosus TaxID=931172 RepID=A0AAV6UFG6_9ARAC|nr:hypothetical protein JTE90_005671 [Oedothorax gibbosus]
MKTISAVLLVCALLQQCIDVHGIRRGGGSKCREDMMALCNAANGIIKQSSIACTQTLNMPEISCSGRDNSKIKNWYRNLSSEQQEQAKACSKSVLTQAIETANIQADCKEKMQGMIEKISQF